VETPQKIAIAVVVVGVAVLGAVMLTVGRVQPRDPAELEARAWESPRRARLRDEQLPDPFQALRPLHLPKRRPGPSDWLAQHTEDGQTYADWKASSPVRATADRRTLYLQPLGELSKEQAEVVAETVEYVRRYFGLQVVSLPLVEKETFGPELRRYHPTSLEAQLWTGGVLEYLHARRPEDALALFALTGEDLFPQSGWNFVFGQASLKERVGVWSLYRLGDPAAGERERAQTLRRAVGIAVHELGHMVSMHHCVAWECVMNGINHLGEMDSAPLEPCPACLAKLCDATGCDPAARFEALAGFWRERGLQPQAQRYLQSARERVQRGGASR
jgi:archaemetzincin